MLRSVHMHKKLCWNGDPLLKGRSDRRDEAAAIEAGGDTRRMNRPRPMGLGDRLGRFAPGGYGVMEARRIAADLLFRKSLNSRWARDFKATRRRETWRKGQRP
jgi:hypothetical protein